jgi:hypothetical protein
LIFIGQEDEGSENMVGQIIFGIIGVTLGVVMIIYSRYIVENITGPIGFAERYLGGAGTYLFIRLVGILIFLVSLLIMFGFLGWVYDAIINPGKTVTGGLKTK